MCPICYEKVQPKSIQYQPKPFINSQLVPCVGTGSSFKYLGRYFDFQMSNYIDQLPLHPKYKILLYSRHLLLKISWHFTVADLSKTWVSENLNNIVASDVRKWLEIPVCGTLGTVFTKAKFGLSLYPPSFKFSQCQTVARNALKCSSNEDIKHLWKSTSTHTNLQYDRYRDKKEALKAFRSFQGERLQSHLVSQESFFSAVISKSLPKLNFIWSSVQSSLPKNISNFTVRYINNALPTRKNLSKWGLTTSSDCHFCLKPESLLRVVAGCSNYLNEGRYTWWHDSVLHLTASYYKEL